MSENLIKFKKERSSWKDEEHSDITTFKKQTIFRNANLVNLESGQVALVDMLVENFVVAKIVPAGTLKGVKGAEIVDLFGSLVMPPFYDAFVDWQNLIGLEHLPLTEKSSMMLSELMGMKSVMAGVEFYVDAREPNMVLKDMPQKSDQQLSEMSDKLAKKGGQVFLQVGQTLEELGSVDKMFGKSLPHVLEDFGFLERSWVLVGGNCFEKDDLQVFSQQENPKYVICPSQDARLARRPVNVVLLKSLGFDIRIGSGNSFEIDFFAFMRQILMTQWEMYEDANCISEKDVLLMATNLKSTICENDQANFIVLQNTPSLYENVHKLLVWGKSKCDILMTVYGGRILQSGGMARSSISGLQYEELIKEILKEKKD